MLSFRIMYKVVSPNKQSKNLISYALSLQSLRCFKTNRTLQKNTKKNYRNKFIRKFKKNFNDSMESKSNKGNHAKSTSTGNGKVLDSGYSSNESTHSAHSSQKLFNFYDRNGPVLRKWEAMDHTYGAAEREFTLMSYNILAQELLQRHSYLYSNHNKTVLEWPYRLARLREEIFQLKPDILCLQEVQSEHIHIILKSLDALEFNYVFKKKSVSGNDGCAILFNRKRFKLLERHSVEYYQPDIEHLDRDNIAIVAKLCLTQDPQSCFIVATTHLLYNPKRQDVRLAQIQVLLAELDRLTVVGFYPNNHAKRLPIILTGDFNLQPFSAPYNLITMGNLSYQNLTRLKLEEPTDENVQLTGKRFLPPRLGITDKCQHIDMIANGTYQGSTRLRNMDKNNSNRKELTLPESDDEVLKNKFPLLFSSGQLMHNLNLTSVYDHQNANGQKEGTTFQEFWVTVDYIFYSSPLSPSINSVNQGYLKLLSRYAIPTIDECHAIGHIPNTKLGSDHLSLAAKFFLQAPRR